MNTPKFEIPEDEIWMKQVRLDTDAGTNLWIRVHSIAPGFRDIQIVGCFGDNIMVTYEEKVAK